MRVPAIREIRGRCGACGTLLGKPEPEPEPCTLVYDRLVLDLLERTARVGEAEVAFPGLGPGDTTWPLLVLLARAGGDLVTLDAQLEAIYGQRSGKFLRRALNVARHRLRAKLAPLGVTIRTRHGVGMALEVP